MILHKWGYCTMFPSASHDQPIVLGNGIMKKLKSESGGYHSMVGESSTHNTKTI